MATLATLTVRLPAHQSRRRPIRQALAVLRAVAVVEVVPRVTPGRTTTAAVAVVEEEETAPRPGQDQAGAVEEAVEVKLLKIPYILPHTEFPQGMGV